MKAWPGPRTSVNVMLERVLPSNFVGLPAWLSAWAA